MIKRGKKDETIDEKNDFYFSYEMTFDYLEKFISYTNIIKNINKNLSDRKIRMPNFPSEISENIVKFAIKKIKKTNPIWNVKNGDLIDGINKIEVKGFSSNGPTSFGPKEEWDILYFINCKKYREKYFEIFEINLSNKDDKFRNIKINSKNTFGEIADLNQCGKSRAKFSIFKKELGNDCRLIFSGNIKELC